MVHACVKVKSVKSEKKNTWFPSQCKQMAAIDFLSFLLITQGILFGPTRNPEFSLVVAVKIIKKHVSHLSLK